MPSETNKTETAGEQVVLPRKDTLNGLDAAARGAVEGMYLVLNVLAILRWLIRTHLRHNENQKQESQQNYKFMIL